MASSNKTRLELQLMRKNSILDERPGKIIMTSQTKARSISRLWEFAKKGLSLVSLLLISITTANAAEMSALTPPDVEYLTDVYIDIYDVKIFRIDENAEIFEVEATLEAQWFDSRQQFDEELVGASTKVFEGAAAENALKTDIWWPNFDVEDSRGPRNIINQSVSVESDGTVYYRERLTAEIMQPFQLNDFPFDSHDISFRIVPFTSLFSTDFNFASYADLDNVTLNWNPEEWEIYNPELMVTSGHCPETPDFSEEYRECENGDFIYSAEDSAATVFIEISRVPKHYLSNYVLPIMLIVLISTAVFFMGFEHMHLGDRLSVSFTSVLTIVAFDFVASENLPKLGYSTGIDHILTTAYVFLAFNVLENVIASRLYLSQPNEALRMDTTFRKFYPAAFMIVVLVIIALLQIGS